MLTVLLALVIGLIVWAVSMVKLPTDFQLTKLFLVLLLGSALSVLLFSGFGFFLADYMGKDVSVREVMTLERHLVASTPKSSLDGHMFLGTGVIRGVDKYVYWYLGGGGQKEDTIERFVNDITVIQTATPETSYFRAFKLVADVEPWKLFFIRLSPDKNQGHVYYQFIVPPGSVKNIIQFN